MKTPIKMIVTDLDGTLLKTDKTISSRTITALNRCKQQGIKLAYATGRGGSATKVTPPGLFDGSIIANGAYAKAGDTTVYKRIIPYQTIRPLLMACDKRGLHVSSQLNGMDYANFTISEAWTAVTDFMIVDFSKHDKDAEKIISANLTPEDIAFIEAHLPADTYLLMTMDGFAMIMHNQAIKSKAIAALATHWGIAREEIVAFGDDLNDFDMLTYAGIGIAMSNALGEVKSVADFICQSNDDDGIALWLEEEIFR